MRKGLLKLANMLFKTSWEMKTLPPPPPLSGDMLELTAVHVLSAVIGSSRRQTGGCIIIDRVNRSRGGRGSSFFFSLFDSDDFEKRRGEGEQNVEARDGKRTA